MVTKYQRGRWDGLAFPLVCHIYHGILRWTLEFLACASKEVDRAAPGSTGVIWFTEAKEVITTQDNGNMTSKPNCLIVDIKRME